MSPSLQEETAYVSSFAAGATTMTAEERRAKRKKAKYTAHESDNATASQHGATQLSSESSADDRLMALLGQREDELLKFVAKVNRVYQDCLKKDAPFMTFVFCGMQSAGKSTCMERFLNAVLNIVQEGTGTRCPLDTTCIHDDSLEEPACDLWGEELPEDQRGEDIPASLVFERITKHNKMLAEEDRFSTKSLHLVFKSKHVQNMRFVDTPGIICNESTGKDNREDIKMILRSEMKKPNTKLCVLLEPKEFATNPIIGFCDESLGGRAKWINDSTFLMTKFDKQLEDSRTAPKANAFFKEFFANKCTPHLVMTPTLEKEDLAPEKLFRARMKLLQNAEAYETDKFEQWSESHERFRAENEDEEDHLDANLKGKIGFATAKRVMRDIMLKDTIERLPEVVASLRRDLEIRQAEEKELSYKLQFSDGRYLKDVVGRMLRKLEERVLSYLNGNLEVALKLPQMLQTLEDEIDDEDESEWRLRELNHHSGKEDYWRDRIANLAVSEGFPKEIQPDGNFLGGKQYQRAVGFYGAVMIEALPDPYQLKEHVASATGFLGGGLLHENWEQAMVKITRASIRDVSHPGINYLIKHVGQIFRRLFQVALMDIKEGEADSAEFRLVPQDIEKYLEEQFDDMLWKLMEDAAKATHTSLEPMYSTIDPALPTFHANKIVQEKEDYYVAGSDGGFVKASEKDSQSFQDKILASVTDKLKALVSTSGSEAKRFLKSESRQRATGKQSFLPDQRSAMITDEEANVILQRSFEYIVALLEFNLCVFKFHLNHHLYEGFKREMRSSFVEKVREADWNDLAKKDPGLETRLEEVKKEVAALSESLRDVQKMQKAPA